MRPSLDVLVRGLGQTEREERTRRASEFSHGRGLTPPGAEHPPPADGGRYHGLTPPVEPDTRFAHGEIRRAQTARHWPEHLH